MKYSFRFLNTICQPTFAITVVPPKDHINVSVHVLPRYRLMSKGLHTVDDSSPGALLGLLPSLTIPMVDMPLIANLMISSTVFRPFDSFHVRHFQIHEACKTFSVWNCPRADIFP